MKSRARALYDKSLAAILSSIEIYNKPDFEYREETFFILAVNAWELLLKARILQLDRNRVSSILEYEHRKNGDGSVSLKLYRRKNRSGNYVSIGLFKAYDLLTSKYGEGIDSMVRENLELITEIRDNSIHFFNRDFELQKRILEVGTGCLKNYVTLSTKWFGADLGKYNFFIMPIGFVRDISSAEGINLNSEERSLLEYIDARYDATAARSTADYALALEVDLKFRRKGGGDASEVRITNDPSAVAIRIDEQDVFDRYPWTYDNLTKYLSNRYADFKQNNKYHKLRQSLEEDSKFCHERLLNPNNPQGGRKRLYNANTVSEFDRIYARRA